MPLSLPMQMAAEGQDDKIEDDGFKRSVLGDKVVNPFTGQSSMPEAPHSHAIMLCAME